MPMFPSYINIMFVGLLITLVVLILFALNYAHKKIGTPSGKRVKIVGLTLLGIIVFLGIQGVLASTGFFAKFDTLPPRVFMLPVSCFIIITIVATRKSTSKLLAAIPETWLIYVQSFRIIMEIILWRLFVEAIIPIQMTFEGYNYDILSGIIPPLIAFMVIKKNVLSRGWLIFANVFGLALVTIIFVIAVLSAPVPFRQFMNEPANTMVAYLPYIWLPGFVAPAAYFFHILSLKQILINKKNKT